MGAGRGRWAAGRVESAAVSADRVCAGAGGGSRDAVLPLAAAEGDARGAADDVGSDFLGRLGQLRDDCAGGAGDVGAGAAEIWRLWSGDEATAGFRRGHPDGAGPALGAGGGAVCDACVDVRPGGAAGGGGDWVGAALGGRIPVCGAV